MSNKTFDIYKIVLDKFLFAILIIIAGVYGNRAIESFRSDEDFRGELRLRQVEKIAEVWELIYAYEESADRITALTNRAYGFSLLGKGKGSTWAVKEFQERRRLPPSFYPSSVEGMPDEVVRAGYVERMEELLGALDKQEMRARAKAVENRFWLGEKRYHSALEMLDLIQHLKANERRYSGDGKYELTGMGAEVTETDKKKLLERVLGLREQRSVKKNDIEKIRGELLIDH